MNYVIVVAALVTIAAILAYLVVLGVKALKKPMVTGYEGMVGECGIVRKPLGFRGRTVIEIRGELWWCRSEKELTAGEEVRVISHDPDNPILIVESCELKGV